MLNHPVHIVTKENKLSPSAFIPFCAFGRNQTAMGFMKDNFELPICNSFQATIFRHGLCYEVDLEMHRNSNYIEEDLSIGLVFFMDYNEDRQTKDTNAGWQKTHDEGKDAKDGGFVKKIIDLKQDDNAFIYFNSIGNIIYFPINVMH